MKLFAAILMLLLCAPALAVSDEAGQVEATTAITLPVDSVTIYPDGLMAVKRTGNLDVTEGVHKFVINVPEKAEQSSVLLRVSNATQERVVYDANPVYTLNISAPGSQSFDLSYLMYDAATWKPVYDLHLLSDSVLVKANAVLSNRGGEDLKNVRLKLVAGLPLGIEPYLCQGRAPDKSEICRSGSPGRGHGLCSRTCALLRRAGDALHLRAGRAKRPGHGQGDRLSPLRGRVASGENLHMGCLQPDRGPSQGGDPGQQHPDQSLADGKSSALQK